MFNIAEENRVAAINAGNAIDAAKFNNQIDMQVKTFNEQADLQREQWNAANAQAVEQSNIQWRRQANTIDTAATNAANQENLAKALGNLNTNIKGAFKGWTEAEAIANKEAIVEAEGIAAKLEASGGNLLAPLDELRKDNERIINDGVSSIAQKEKANEGLRK